MGKGIKKRGKRKEKEEKKLLKTDKRSQASEFNLIQSLGKKVGNVIVGVNIG
jgi:hypothetical protein